MRPKIVVANWKMNKDLHEGRKLAGEIVQQLARQPQKAAQVVLIPPFIHLEVISKLLQPWPQLYLGAQNCHEQPYGAFTGEIAAPMLSSAGATFVLIGHSERRKYFQEKGTLLAQKTSVALDHGLRPIFCCGEDKAIRSAGTQEAFVVRQLREGLFHLDHAQIAQAVIAYEPVWAIGTGDYPAPEQVQAMHQAIRSAIAQQYSQDIAQSIPILYGGSCNTHNASTLFACPDVDGGLIGKAALNADDFTAIVHAL